MEFVGSISSSYYDKIAMIKVTTTESQWPTMISIYELTSLPVGRQLANLGWVCVWMSLLVVTEGEQIQAELPLKCLSSSGTPGLAQQVLSIIVAEAWESKPLCAGFSKPLLTTQMWTSHFSKQVTSPSGRLKWNYMTKDLMFTPIIRKSCIMM